MTETQTVVCIDQHATAQFPAQHAADFDEALPQSLAQHPPPAVSSSSATAHAVVDSTASAGAVDPDFLAPSYSFLERVKMESVHQPHVFDSFLHIMKGFGSAQLNTIGVVTEVVKLFAGKDALLAQFATFLPLGHQIVTVEQYSATAAEKQAEPSAHVAEPIPDSNYILLIPVEEGDMAPSLPPPSRPASAPATSIQEEAETTALLPPPPLVASPKPSGMEQALEFVRRVRIRLDEAYFQSFLDLLHSIQTQPKSFIEIVHEVSNLFKDHPDLLRDFPLFLPFEVRESAMQEIDQIIARRKRSQSVKEKRGHTSAKQASSSSFSKRSNSILSAGSAVTTTTTTTMAHAPTAPPPNATSAGANAATAAAGLSGRHVAARRTNLAKSESPYFAPNGLDHAAYKPPAFTQLQQLHSPTPPPPQVLVLPLPKAEENIFHRLKVCFANHGSGSLSSSKWNEFLLCLQLVESGLISRYDLITLGQDWFAGSLQLRVWEEFDRHLAARGFTDNAQEDAWFSLPATDVYFDAKRAVTTPSLAERESDDALHKDGINISYHFLPKTYPAASSALASPLLNSHLVAVPYHLNPNYNPSAAAASVSSNTAFSATRNACEEKLFKCEDEQYEFSLLVDCNLSVIQFLESALASNGADQYAPLQDLSILHLKAIARVYGEDSGQIFESLKKNPAATMPVILQRLKQKDLEWRLETARQEDGAWKDVLRDNLRKSLDYQTGVFKSSDKKLFKSFLTELNKPSAQIELKFDDFLIHKHAAKLLSLFPNADEPGEEGSTSISNQILLETFASQIIPNFPSMGVWEEKSNAFLPGQPVLTNYGRGVVLEQNAENSVSVKLPGEIRTIDKHEVMAMALHQLEEEERDGAKEPRAVCLNHDGYLFVRFYHLLCERLVVLKQLCEKQKLELDKFIAEHIAPLLAGTNPMAAAQLEEQCNATFGNKAYFCMTLDKLAQQLVKLLQGLVNEERAVKMAEVCKRFQPDSVASCIEMRKAQLDALQFPRNCPCAGVFARQNGSTLTLTFSTRLPGEFDADKLVMEFFHPLQVHLAQKARARSKDSAPRYTLSIFTSHHHAANAANFESKQNASILKTLKVGGSGNGEDWWTACLTTHESILLKAAAQAAAAAASSSNSSSNAELSEEEEEVVPVRKRRKVLDDDA